MNANPTESPELVAQAAFYEGPLPPAIELANYNLAHPGTAERIIKMAEQNNVHSMEAQRQQISANIEYQRKRQMYDFVNKLTGQICGFIIAVSAIVLAGVLAFHGMPGWGSGAFLFGIAALVGAYMYGHQPGAKPKTPL